MILLFHLLLLTLSSSTTAQLETPHNCITTSQPYSPNSTYSSNLNTTLSSLSTNIPQTGFLNTSTGQPPNTVYATALCRADITLSECRRCLQNGAVQIKQFCPNQTQAIIWNELCTLRYSNQPVYGILSNEPVSGLVNTQDVTNAVRFREDRTALMDAVREEASNGTSVLKVGAGSRETADSVEIYAMVQCTPDLSSDDCNNCLILATRPLSQSAQGMRILMPSCNIRYELYNFYNETRLRELEVLVVRQAPSPTPSGTSDNNNRGDGKEDNTTKIVLIIVIPIGVVILIFVCAVIYLKKRKKQRDREISEVTGDISTEESLQYDFHKISDATDGFADVNKLGEGGFGAVYKGKLQNGQEIAVKRLSRECGQGDVEFKNEVLLLAKLQHRNLVRLLGFSIQGRERLLVYEFVSNGSLDQFIFDPIKCSVLDWETRHKIIGGISKGLLYLHEDSRLKIIHRDLKASNILLDRNMNPKIADFGMAKLFGQDETQGNTSRIVGTYGYMSPEYAMKGQFSTKSDIYSFGVLMLEIVSGRKNLFREGEDMHDLLTFAWEHWGEGTPENVIDPTLRAGKGSLRDMLRCVHIGLLCVQEDAANRPTINSVVLMLNNTTITLSVPSHPAYVMSGRFGPNTSEIIKAGVSNSSTQNEMSVTDLYPR